MTTTTLTGLTEGDFHTLRVLSGGVMTDILTLIGGGGGGVPRGRAEGAERRRAAEAAKHDVC